MTNQRIVYVDDPKISAIKVDTVDNFVWVAFEKNTSDIVVLEKQTGTDPSQSVFSVNKSVDEINSMDIDATNLYVAYEDDTLFGEQINKDNPITLTVTIPFPVSANESPIYVRINGSDIWFLTPGSASGENAKLYKYDTTPTLQETVDLTKSGAIVTNAQSFDFDSNGDIWIVTNTSPANYVRVYALSGGGYDFTVHTTL